MAPFQERPSGSRKGAVALPGSRRSESRRWVENRHLQSRRRRWLNDDDHLPLSAIAFNVSEGLSDLGEGVVLVDDDPKSSLFDQARELSQIVPARMHEQISVADPRAPRPL